MMDLVSVIIPTYNRAALLQRAIDSVIEQDYKNLEIIIVDDGSTDETSSVLEKYPHFQIIKTENHGVSSARNLGITKATGEYLAFLDSDDEWLKGKITAQVNFLKENPTIPLVHTEEIWIRNGVRVNQMNKHKKSGGDIFIKSLALCLISPSSVLIRKKAIEELGLFDTDMIVCEDYDLWLRLTATNQVGFLEKPFIRKYGGHEDQLSHRYFAMDFYRVKSMYKLLLSELQISKEKRGELIKMIIKKCEILMNGYRKHNNLNDFETISSIYKRVQNGSN